MTLALLVSFAFVAGCTRRADLVPFPAAGSSICDVRQGQRVSLLIANQGKGPSKATTTDILFGSLPPVRLPTRPIGPAESTSLSYRIPDRCPPGDCAIRILVDSKDEVAESDESNNSIEECCCGG